MSRGRGFIVRLLVPGNTLWEAVNARLDTILSASVHAGVVKQFSLSGRGGWVGSRPQRLPIHPFKDDQPPSIYPHTSPSPSPTHFVPAFERRRRIGCVSAEFGDGGKDVLVGGFFYDEYLVWDSI